MSWNLRSRFVTKIPYSILDLVLHVGKMTMASGPSPRPPPPPPPRPPPPPPPRHPPPHNSSSSKEVVENGTSGGSEETRLTAAADLIKTLDSAYAEMSSLSASAAKDAEDARRNARAASEVARRYTARSYPLSSFPASPKATTTPIDSSPATWRTAQWTPAAARDLHQSPVSPSSSNNKPDSPSARKRKITNKPTLERLAQSHAEDVLSLSLELERTKQALEAETQAHQQTRTDTEHVSSKNTQLEKQIEKLLNDMERQREDSGRKTDALEQELSRAQVRVQAAEEDAQVALDLAKSNGDNLEEVESWLQKALVENQLLREQLQRIGVKPGSVLPTSPDNPPPPPPGKSVRFAESPTIVTVPNRQGQTGPVVPPAMVSAGRQLLQRTATDNEVHQVRVTPQKSAERRQRLRERLKSLDADVTIPTPTKSAVKSMDDGIATKAMETCQVVANLLIESGRRLGLNGHWWTSHNNGGRADVGDVDSMTRHYCQSVEVCRSSRTCVVCGFALSHLRLYRPRWFGNTKKLRN